MAADANLLRGECFENPKSNEVLTEELLIGFITALLEEQNHFQILKEVNSGEKCG